MLFGMTNDYTKDTIGDVHDTGTVKRCPYRGLNGLEEAGEQGLRYTHKQWMIPLDGGMFDAGWEQCPKPSSPAVPA